MKEYEVIVSLKSSTFTATRLSLIEKGNFMSTFVEKGWFTLPQSIVSRLSVVIGEGGSGKTETILRTAHLVASTYSFDIIMIDAKGDEDLAPRFVASMQQADKKRIKLFPTSPYNGWVGDVRTLYNRLMAVHTYTEPYYEGIAQMMLDLALKAPGGPPRNSRELLRNLRLDQLRILYRGLPEQDELAGLRAEDANGVYNRYRAFFKSLDGKLDGGSSSFTFDEIDAAYVKLDTVAFANECSNIGRYIVEDIAHYITCRKPKDKKVLIIIDEVSALAIENIANLSERLRSFRGAMMLTSQSEEGLAKTQDERTRILKTSHILILHTCNTPEKLVERAGKYKQIHTGWSVRDQEGTGYGMVHMSDEYIVPPDEARRLDVGECFVIAKGSGYKVRVAPLQIDRTSVENAEAFIEQEAVFNATTQPLEPSSKGETPVPPFTGLQRLDNNEHQKGQSEPDKL